MGGVVDAIFGGGGDDNSAQLAEMQRQNAEQQKKLDEQKAQMDTEERKRQEAQSASARARRSGGTRALMDAMRLNPEEGLAGQDSATRKTLGPS